MNAMLLGAGGGQLKIADFNTRTDYTLSINPSYQGMQAYAEVMICEDKGIEAAYLNIRNGWDWRAPIIASVSSLAINVPKISAIFTLGDALCFTNRFSPMFNVKIWLI